MNAAGQTLTIGRAHGCDVILAHASVSRRHAELTFLLEGGIEIRDLNSTGGTFVCRNGTERSLTQTRLEKGDVLRLGDFEIPLEELLSLAGRASPEKKTAPAAASPAPTGLVNDNAERPKTRMVRCDCGTIKERGGKCPACGT